MIYIAICDDDEEFLKELEEKVLTFFSNQTESCKVITFSSGKELLAQDSQTFDLLFLDICMPGLSGLDLANAIRKDPALKNTSIIFISTIKDYVFDSFQYEPLRYMRKECIADELADALNAFMKHHQNLPQDFQIEIKEKGSARLLPIKNIYYVELSGHYVDFYCIDQTLHVRDGLATYEKLLSEHGFYRISQSLLVNFVHIRTPKNDSVILDTGKELYISRSCKNQFHSAYMEWERGHTHVLTV